jgi:Prolyl 4-Hydroxylase alpha-subunit, N-terminal region
MLEKFFGSVRQALPDGHDLNGAVEGLLRLQTIYKLQSEDFANGTINGRKTRGPMTAHDLYTIGIEAFKLKHQDFFVQKYLNLAWKLLKQGTDPDNEIDRANCSSSYVRATVE